MLSHRLQPGPVCRTTLGIDAEVSLSLVERRDSFITQRCFEQEAMVVLSRLDSMLLDALGSDLSDFSQEDESSLSGRCSSDSVCEFITQPSVSAGFNLCEARRLCQGQRASSLSRKKDRVTVGAVGRSLSDVFIADLVEDRSCLDSVASFWRDRFVPSVRRAFCCCSCASAD